MAGSGGSNSTYTIYYSEVWQRLNLTPNPYCQNLRLGLNRTFDNLQDAFKPYEGDRLWIDEYNNIILKTD
jgi:hypothetical protein